MPVNPFQKKSSSSIKVLVDAAALFDTVAELRGWYANALVHLTEIQGVFGLLEEDTNFDNAKSIKTTFDLMTLAVKLAS